MKKYLILPALVAFAVLSFTSCEKSVENSLTFDNRADGGLLINFKGNVYTVDAHSTLQLKELAKGIYTYSTTFEIPAGASAGAAQGDVTGTITLKAGTNILVLYSSTLIDGNYTLFATISNSDDQTPEDENVTGP